MRFTQFLLGTKIHYTYYLFKEKQYNCDKHVGLVAF